jgi:hypothetical protein
MLGEDCDWEKIGWVLLYRRRLMDDIPLNSAAFILSWYQQNVDARASGARFETDPDGKRSDRIIIMYDCGLADQAVDLDFVRSCLAFKDWLLSSRKKWTTPRKVEEASVFGAIRDEEGSAQLEHRSPSMRNVLSILRRQKSGVGYDKLLLSFDEGFSEYLKAIGPRTDWRW